MDNITTILKAQQVKKVAMFTDKGIEKCGLFTMVEDAVKAAETEYYVLDDLPAEPAYMDVQKLVDQFKTSGADMIVACGGGSVMDAAKLASVLVTDEYGCLLYTSCPGMDKSEADNLIRKYGFHVKSDSNDEIFYLTGSTFGSLTVGISFKNGKVTGIYLIGSSAYAG